MKQKLCSTSQITQELNRFTIQSCLVPRLPVGKFEYSNGLWQSFVIIGSCNHLMSIKQEKKPVNRFLQDGASAGIRLSSNSAVHVRHFPAQINQPCPNFLFLHLILDADNDPELLLITYEFRTCGHKALCIGRQPAV